MYAVRALAVMFEHKYKNLVRSVSFLPIPQPIPKLEFTIGLLKRTADQKGGKTNPKMDFDL
jgi:hypothetical protein